MALLAGVLMVTALEEEAEKKVMTTVLVSPEGVVMERVLAAAVMEERVAVAEPEALVVAGAERVLPEPDTLRARAVLVSRLP